MIESFSISDIDPNTFVYLDHQKQLWLQRFAPQMPGQDELPGGPAPKPESAPEPEQPILLAILSKLDLEQQVTALNFCHPYVCITERYGLQGAVVNVETKAILPISREDYHADVSSFSAGFVKWQGRTLLIHQTQWNRLDATDPETGECLSEREVYCRYEEEEGTAPPGRREEQNYLDYFHSQLVMSPDRSCFLSNGWVWGPADNIRCYAVDKFMTGYDPAGFGVDYASGYNWDRPAAFLDNDCFVIAADDQTGELDEEEKQTYTYCQFLFFRLRDWKTAESRWLPSCQRVVAEAFPKNEYGEVTGQLHYDPQQEQLLAVSQEGTRFLALNGELQDFWPDIKWLPSPVRGFGQERQRDSAAGWQYSREHRFFYQLSEGDSSKLVGPVVKLRRVFLAPKTTPAYNEIKENVRI